jgi:mono/diheme cytochrome c family protein
MNKIFTTTTRNLVLGAAMICGAASVSACRGGIKQKPPVHPQQNMDNAHYIEAQEKSDFFDDERGMRPPVPGTIAQGDLRTDTAYYEGAENGEYVSELPGDLELTDEFLDRGQEEYGIYCTPCHGSAGRGQGIVGKRAQQFGSLIPTFHDETRRSYPVGRIYNVITNGYNTMYSYAAQIPVEDRWAIASYVRVLQINQGASEEQYATRPQTQGEQE